MFKKHDILPCVVEEGARIQMYGNNIIVGCSTPNPSEEDVHNFEWGKVEFGVCSDAGLLVFATKIGNEPWLFCGYDHTIMKQLSRESDEIFAEPNLDLLRQGESMQLKLYLVDTSTKEVVGKRVFTIPTSLKCKVIDAITVQKEFIVPIISSSDEMDKIGFLQYIQSWIHTIDGTLILKNMEKIHFKSRG